MGYDFDLLKGVLREEFGRHGEKTVESNITAAQAGFDYARQEYSKKATHRIQPVARSRKIMLTGHGLVAISDDTFVHHVNSERNDFSRWVMDVIRTKSWQATWQGRKTNAGAPNVNGGNSICH